MADPFDEPDNDPVIVPGEPQVEAEPEIEAEAPEEVEAPVEAETEAEPEEATVPQVPIHTLHEARQQNRELRNELQAVRQQMEGFESLKKQLDEQRRAAQQQQEHEQFNQDPLGALQQDIKALREQQEAEKAEAAQRQAQQEEAQRLEQTVTSYVNEFSQSNPDYPDAVQHMLNSRAEELKFMGLPQEQIQMTLQQEAEALAYSAVQNGDNPAEVVYNLARLRGYAPKQQKAPSVDKLAKGQAAAQTMSDTQGGADEVSLIDIEKMSDEEFDAFWEKEMRG